MNSGSPVVPGRILPIPLPVTLCGDAGRTVTSTEPPRHDTGVVLDPHTDGGSALHPSVSSAFNSDSMRSTRAVRADVIIEGCLISALVDTGASHSLVSASLAGRLGLILVPWDLSLVAADGRSLSTSGAVTASLVVGGCQFSWRFGVINNLGCDALLGCDFLARNRATVSFAKRRLFLPSAPKPVPVVFAVDFPTAASPVLRTTISNESDPVPRPSPLALGSLYLVAVAGDLAPRAKGWLAVRVSSQLMVELFNRRGM